MIGHIGISLTAFEGAAIPGGPIATLHMLDWLGSAGHPSVGVSLMRKANDRRERSLAWEEALTRTGSASGRDTI